MILWVATVADRRPWAAATAKVAAELPAVQRRGWRWWPAVQLINQSLVPLEVRLGVLGFACAHLPLAQMWGQLGLASEILSLRQPMASWNPANGIIDPSPSPPPPTQLRVLCNNAVAVVWTAFVISRARAVRGSKRVLPVCSLQDLRHAHSL